MITHWRYRQLINMILTKLLFRFTSPSIYCYQKIAAPSDVGGLFCCLDIQVIRQKGYILGNVFVGRLMSSKIILTWLIDISDAFIDEMNHWLQVGMFRSLIPRECGERCSILVQSSTILQENAMVIFGVFISGNDISESYVFAKEVFQDLCLWVWISTI